MVAHLLRLKLTLLRNGLRRSPWQVVGLVVGSLYGLGVLGLVVAGMVALSVQDADLRRTVVVLLGSLLVLGWWVIPLVAFGVDATVDPARFATFAVPRRTLLVGLGLGGLVGVPGVITTVAVLAMGAVWWRDPAALLAGLVCALVALATCVVGSRATTTALAPLVGRRRVREVLAVLAVLPFVLLGPILGQVASVVRPDSLDTFRRATEVLAWTPLGAAWSVPADLADGRPGLAVLRLLIALATLALLVLVWDRSLARTLVNPPHTEPAGRGRGLGWFGRFPATPLGAVAARCLIYWTRDPRYAMAVAIVPLLPFILYFVAPGGRVLLVLGPSAAFLLGWTISADVAYDGSAFWTHVAAPLAGRVDRWGRVLAVLVFAVPVVLVLTVGSALFAGRADALPALIGAALGVLLTALAASSIVSALVVYPVQQPGDNPFQTRQGASLAAFSSQLLGWLTVVVASLPEIVLAIVAVGQRSAALGVVALVVGLLLGAVLLLVGTRVGGRLLDRNGPDLLRRILAFP